MVTTEYRLGELCKLRNGYAFKSGDYVKVGTPVIRISNIKENESSTKDAKRVKSSDKFNDYLIKKGDILIAMSGATTGKFGRYISKEVAYQNQRVGCFVIKDEEKLNQDFLYLLLKQLKPKIEADAYGGGQPNISSKTIEQYKVEIPSLADQKRISSVLEKTDNLINQRKESIELADEFLKHTFLTMFGDPAKNEKGWGVMSGKEYLEKLTVGVVVKPASHYVESGVIALRSLNIKPNRIDLNNLVYFSKVANETILSKSILRTGDVVFVRTGNTGTAAIIPEELDGCNCIDLIISRPNPELVNPSFLIFFFNSEIGKRIVTSKEVGGIQKHFNIGALKALRIPIPPINLQSQFAEIANQIETIKREFEKSLIELQELYRSLSHKAFNGELTIIEKIELEGSIKLEPKISGTIELIETEDEDDEYRSYTNDRTEPWHFGIDEVDSKIKDKSHSETKEVASSITQMPFLKTEEDLLNHISKKCTGSHFTFDDIKEAVKGLDWSYDFEELKNLVFSLIRKKQIKQVFADASYKSGFSKSDADYKEITDLSEQIYFKRML